MKIGLCLLVFTAGLMATVGFAAEPEINLLREGSFKPVMMHGRPSAAHGWWLVDQARIEHEKRTKKYLSGEGCFALAFKDGTMTISFPDPLNPAYVKQYMEFSSSVSQPVPPAPQYLASGKVKLDKGNIVLGNGKTLLPQADWQSFSLKTPRPFEKFTIQPEAGASFSVADFKNLAVYPKIGGEINLPGGGKLTRLFLPHNASYLMRWSIALWRGWLWKITGVALPIEVVSEVIPVPGTFAAVQRETAPGGWQLKVDKSGIVLTYGEELAMAPALFDFLRGLGYTFYAHGCVVELQSDPQRVLPLTDKQVTPRFRYLTAESVPAAYMNGGLYRYNIYDNNTVDWFHYPWPYWGHITNIAMPREIYSKAHPEYYMMDRSGNRVIHENPNYINPCLSNPDAMRIIAENLIAFTLNQAPHPDMAFWLGDNSGYCLCPNCVKLNHGIGSYSDLMMMLLNKVAAGIANERPDMKVLYSPYASWHRPPVKADPGKNITCLYALTHYVVPCTVHVDCELNRTGYAELAQWSRLMGGRDNVGIVTYRDLRPLHHLARMEHLTKYAGRELFIWGWKGYSPAIPFVTARWNLGEDPNKLVEEFNDHYYGKGGKFITQIEHFVEAFAAAYQHTPEELKSAATKHICIWGEDLNSRTVLDRVALDKIYPLFDRALAAVGDEDNTARRHILRERAFYLREDLNKYRRHTCTNEVELAGFVKRLVDFIKIAREVQKLQVNALRLVSGRDFVAAVAGLKVPDTGKAWPFEPALEKIVADPNPQKYFR